MWKHLRTGSNTYECDTCGFNKSNGRTDHLTCNGIDPRMRRYIDAAFEGRVVCVDEHAASPCQSIELVRWNRGSDGDEVITTIALPHWLALNNYVDVVYVTPWHRKVE